MTYIFHKSLWCHSEIKRAFNAVYVYVYFQAHFFEEFTSHSKKKKWSKCGTQMIHSGIMNCTTMFLNSLTYDSAYNKDK